MSGWDALSEGGGHRLLAMAENSEREASSALEDAIGMGVVDGDGDEVDGGERRASVSSMASGVSGVSRVSQADPGVFIHDAASHAQSKASASISTTMLALKRCRTSLLRQKLKRKLRTPSMKKLVENRDKMTMRGDDTWRTGRSGEGMMASLRRHVSFGAMSGRSTDRRSDRDSTLGTGQSGTSGSEGEKKRLLHETLMAEIQERVVLKPPTATSVASTEPSDGDGRTVTTSATPRIPPLHPNSTNQSTSFFSPRAPPLTLAFSSMLLGRRMNQRRSGSGSGSGAGTREEGEEKEEGEGEGEGDGEGEEGGCWASCPGVRDGIDTSANVLKENVTDTQWFSALIMVVIILAGLNVGVSTYAEDLDAEVLQVLALLDEIILYIFVAEVVLKVAAEGRTPWKYFDDNWNRFDFIIVVSSFIPLTIRTFLRLVRLLRVLKMVRFLQGLRVLVLSLVRSLSSLGYVTLLVALVFYLYAVTGVILFRKNDPANFGSLEYALVTLFRIALGDDHMDIIKTGIYGCEGFGYASVSNPNSTTVYESGDGFPADCSESQPQPVVIVFYTISFVLLASFVLVNVIISLVVSSVAEARALENQGTTVIVEVVSAKDLPPADVLGTSDPYVKVAVGTMSHSTIVKKRTLNPRWTHQTLEFHPLEDLGTDATIEVYDWDRCSDDDLLCHGRIPLARLPANQPLIARVSLYLSEEMQEELPGRLKPGQSLPTPSLTLKLMKKVPPSTDEKASITSVIDPEDKLRNLTTQSELDWDTVRWDLSEAVRLRSQLRKAVARRLNKARKHLLNITKDLTEKTKEKYRAKDASKGDGGGDGDEEEGDEGEDRNRPVQLAAALGTLADSLGIQLENPLLDGAGIGEGGGGVGGGWKSTRKIGRSAPARPEELRKDLKTIMAVDRVGERGWVRVKAGRDIRWFKVNDEPTPKPRRRRIQRSGDDEGEGDGAAGSGDGGEGGIVEEIDEVEKEQKLIGDVKWFTEHARHVQRSAKRSGSTRDLLSSSSPTPPSTRSPSASFSALSFVGAPAPASMVSPTTQTLTWLAAGEAKLDRNRSVRGLVLSGVDEDVDDAIIAESGEEEEEEEEEGEGEEEEEEEDVVQVYDARADGDED